MTDQAMVHDDISLAQTDAEGAAKLSAEHTAELLYPATPSYPFDAHSSPGGVNYSPSMGDKDAEQR